MGAAEAPEHEVQLVPIGSLPPGLEQDLALRVSARISAACRVARPLCLAEVPTLPERPQADADRLLALLEAGAGLGVVPVGVAAFDLAIPIFTFVFGRARHGGACLISIARLDPAFYGLPADGRLVTERAVVEVLHELGHVAGLAHCRDFACLMHFAASVEAIDVRGARFCAPCAGQLPAWLGPPGWRLAPAQVSPRSLA